MRYCVILYVGHFWLPYFGLVYVQYLLYMPISVIFTPIYFLCLAPQVVFVCGHVVLAQCANEGGGVGVTRIAEHCLQMCARNYSVTRFIVQTQGLMPGPSPDLGPTG